MTMTITNVLQISNLNPHLKLSLTTWPSPPALISTSPIYTPFSFWMCHHSYTLTNSNPDCLSYHAWLAILAPLYPLNPTLLYQMGHCTKHWGHLTCRWGQCDHHTHSCHTCCTSCLSTPQFLTFSLRHTQSMEEPQLSSLLFSPTLPSFMQVIQIPYRHSCTWNPCTIATASTTIASTSSAYQNCLTPPWDCANKTCHQDYSTIHCSHAFLYISTFVEDTLGCSLRFIFTAISSLFIGWSADPLPAGLARI